MASKSSSSLSSSSGIVSFLYSPTIKVVPILEPPIPALVFINFIEDGDKYKSLNGLLWLPKSYEGAGDPEVRRWPPISIVGLGPILNLFKPDNFKISVPEYYPPKFNSKV